MYADWSLKMESNRGALLKRVAMRRDVLLKFEHLSFRHYQRPMSPQQKEKKIKEARIFFLRCAAFVLFVTCLLVFVVKYNTCHTNK